MKQKLIEYPVTEWDEANIRVIISLPGNGHTLTSLMKVDEQAIRQLKNLHPPKHIDKLSPEERMFAYIRWERHALLAEREVQSISNRIANSLADAIRKHYEV